MLKLRLKEHWDNHGCEVRPRKIMKLTEAKLKELILEAYVDDLMTPVFTDANGVLTFPKLPLVDLVNPGTNLKQVRSFLKRPKETFRRAINKIVREFRRYKTSKNRQGWILRDPNSLAYIQIRLGVNMFRVQIKYFKPHSTPGGGIVLVAKPWYSLKDYQNIPDDRQLEVFEAHVRAQIESFIKINKW